jgi:surface antigen
MKIRKTCPKNNKYYIRKAQGGLSDAVFGYPVVKGANVLCNCVGYANSRFNEIINDPNLEYIVKPFKYQLVCNAENFIESAKRQGLKISKTPKVGGIMVWQKGRTLGGGDGAGHVAVVERVYEDGTILTSESGYGAWAFKTIRRDNKNGRWGQNSLYKFRGCIINPSVKHTVTPAPKLKIDGVGGVCTIRAMQRFFGTTQDGVISGQKKSESKHYTSIKSVEFGKGGSPCIRKLQKWVGVEQNGVLDEKTVLAWQKKIKVACDGLFGANSMREWQEYLNTHKKAVYPATTLLDKELSACKKQAEWMQNYKYGWDKFPTIPKSKKRGTCVTYVACVLQRIGYLKSGRYIWHDEHGKVTHATSKMQIIYPKNQTLKSYKKHLKAGDIVMAGKASDVGAGSHIFILTGRWKDGDPIIYDNHSAERVKAGKSGAHTYNGKKKIIAVVRLK